MKLFKLLLFTLLASVAHTVIFYISNSLLEVPIDFSLAMFWTFMGLTWAWAFGNVVNTDTYSAFDESDTTPK